jgi:hypothetical protein
MRAIALTVVFVFGGFVMSANAENANSEEPNKPTVEEQLAKIAKLGPGVHAIKKDKNGRILSCVVVGQSRISTVLGKTKGLQIARDKASLSCAAEFAKWLKEDVIVHESAREENVILTEGKEGAEQDSLSESGKAIEKNSKKMQSLSRALVRGLQVIHKEVDASGKIYTIIKGWKADSSEGVKRVAADLASDEPSANGHKNDKTIENDSATSEDAKDYVP